MYVYVYTHGCVCRVWGLGLGDRGCVVERERYSKCSTILTIPYTFPLTYILLILAFLQIRKRPSLYLLEDILFIFCFGPGLGSNRRPLWSFFIFKHFTAKPKTLSSYLYVIFLQINFECCAIILGATTLSIMTFGIMTFSIMTFGIMTFSIMTALKQMKGVTTHNDTQHTSWALFSNRCLCWVLLMLTVTYAECHLCQVSLVLSIM